MCVCVYVCVRVCAHVNCRTFVYLFNYLLLILRLCQVDHTFDNRTGLKSATMNPHDTEITEAFVENKRRHSNEEFKERHKRLILLPNSRKIKDDKCKDCW